MVSPSGPSETALRARDPCWLIVYLPDCPAPSGRGARAFRARRTPAAWPLPTGEARGVGPAR